MIQMALVRPATQKVLYNYCLPFTNAFVHRRQARSGAGLGARCLAQGNLEATRGPGIVPATFRVAEQPALPPGATVAPI